MSDTDTVYRVVNMGGGEPYVYHTTPDCAHLKRATGVTSLSRIDAESRGLSLCATCNGREYDTETYNTRRCPFCGDDIKIFRKHLPCEESQNHD